MSHCCHVINLSQLFHVSPLSGEQNLTSFPCTLVVEQFRSAGRWHVAVFGDAHGFTEGWQLHGTALVGDTPGLYHPLYALAILSARHAESEQTPLPDWLLPRIVFQTEENVLRSMTLNGMRMSTEYFQSGSLRVLELIENRLQIGQRDVVHNVLVYIARQILDCRSEDRQARDLRAESIAAFLGLNADAVQNLMRERHLNIDNLIRSIEGGDAGVVRRSIDVKNLLRGQMELLQPELEEAQQNEARWLWLLDEIVTRLYEDKTAG